MNVLNEKGLEAILDPENLNAAYLKVKTNKGAAGVDGIGVEQLKAHLKRNGGTILRKLKEGTYEPGLLKVVTIPKPGGGERELNIPNTQDRVIQQAIAQPLAEVFEPLFSDHSYGYRPGRSAHDAVRRMRHYVVEEGCGTIVDVDIQSFFDEVNHDILMQRISDEVRHKPVLKLIGKYLRSGKLVNNRKVKHKGKGIPQGGPLSPLLANIYLTRMDRELEERNVRFVRYADDLTLCFHNEEEATECLEWLSTWCRRHIRKLCWQRWHNWKGRRNALIRLGAKPCHIKLAHSGRGAWRLCKSHSLHTVLNKQKLREWGFWTPSDLVAMAQT